DAEFYFIYDGSMKRHIMFAERIGDNALQSLVPGHGCQEAVSVSVLMYARGSSPVALGSCPVTYRENLSCKLSRFLVSHTECVSATSHKVLLDKFGLTVKDLQSLDTDLTMAIAHEELPSTWSILGSCYDEEPMHKETLLHLAMKLGLVKLSEFLVGQPGGTLALALPNEDGATPLDLAEQNGHSKLVEVFSNFQGSCSPDVARVEISEGACMRFVRSSAALTLTLDHTAKHLLESDVRLFRKYFWNRSLLHEVGTSLAQAWVPGTGSMPSSGAGPEEGPQRWPEAQGQSTLDVFKKLKTPPTFFAASRLSTMLNGSDEVYANCMLVDQVSLCLDFWKRWKGEVSVLQLIRSIVPLALLTEGLCFSFIKHMLIKCCVVCFSSSLDDLEVNSRSESISDRSNISYPLLEHPEVKACSRDGLDPYEMSISRTESLPLSISPQKKQECSPSGIRSRSYSCSSPKDSLGRPRIPQDFTVSDSSEERAYSLPEHSREKRIQEEEWDKYIVPSKTESEKYKVSRTFSFLMNRMTSTRNKYKTKNKDTKDKEKLNRHNFINGTFSGIMPCMACEKALLGKESLQCSCKYWFSCVDLLCSETCLEILFQHSVLKQTLPGFGSNLHPSSSVPIGLSAGRREALQQSHSLSKSVPGANIHFTTVEVDSSQWTDISSDAQEFEAESWSLVVDPMFCNKQEKDVAKRQDVIFELMQTEVHHIHTLYIMSEIFRKGMKEELQLDHSTVDRIFPCLDELLEIHRQFFFRMRERRQESCEEGNERNFVISRIGDILVQQFSEENATKMKKIYGEFCSHQKEAVSLFKELQQNKKFQNFIKLRNSNLLARRRGIPECILLVTQRITKYPVLVERILQYTKEGSEEHKDLCKALRLIKDMIAAVDLKVNEYEKRQKLMEILNRTENKTYTKLKSGHIFRKQDLMGKERILLHEGLVYWKTATGRFKDTLALLLTDMLLFLQEKDQKYIFAAVVSILSDFVQFWLTESLNNQDQQICSCLEDKLHIYAELVDMSGFEDVHVEPHLLIKPDYGETPQAAPLLVAALREGKFVQEVCSGGSSAAIWTDISR
uniref:Rho guanine nucleotide exchange factor 28 n=1 Tax=Chrysolophus pictus TaxID=9089 RepID=A0A8C3Q202_CHRPC